MADKTLGGIRLIRWVLIGLGILGGIFAWYARLCFPIAALLWPHNVLVGIFLVFPVLLILLGLCLHEGHESTRKGTLFGVWFIYALGIIGVIALWLFTGVSSAIVDFSWDLAKQRLFAIENRNMGCLALFHLIVMGLIISTIARYLNKDDVIRGFKPAEEQPSDLE